MQWNRPLSCLAPEIPGRPSTGAPPSLTSFIAAAGSTSEAVVLGGTTARYESVFPSRFQVETIFP